MSNPRIIAHFSRHIRGWTNACAMVTCRGSKFNVYLYTSDGMYETYVSEVQLDDVNDALRCARQYGVNPDSLELYNPTTGESFHWNAPRN